MILRILRENPIVDHRQEVIVAAAICHDDQIFYVDPPGRHHTIIGLMNDQGFTAKDTRNQGFVTNKARYVDRFEGLKIAEEADQILRKTGPEDRLFSEDLW